uniref:Uncharacterized protein n=1 Tax=Rhizophagus irregularis (strain DAOM 181602 / DAOM 197198 / MUCL 43194) TaxID=747089 RepID=U9SYH7_RHIID
MFECLAQVIESYNISGNGRAVFQDKICYMDMSASFKSLNTSITLLYTSCAVGALFLGLFIITGQNQCYWVHIGYLICVQYM